MDTAVPEHLQDLVSEKVGHSSSTNMLSFSLSEWQNASVPAQNGRSTKRN